MKVLFNGDGWSSLEVLAYIILIGYIVAPIICVVVFIFRKNKFWFNYVALIGEIAFFIKCLFHLQHYPGQIILSMAGAPLLLVAFIATLTAAYKNKIPASTKMGIILCLYALMFLNLAKYITSYNYKPQNPVEQTKPTLSPSDKRFIDSVLATHPPDTVHHK